VQPHAAEIIRGQRQALQLLLDGLGNQRRYFLEHFPALLHEELVRFANA
jgi:hypothetical protein